MRFTHHDLGNRSSGEILEIVLSGNAANIRLMDSSNFQSYQSGRRHTFYGGLAKRSPIRLRIPHSGHWHVTVDLGGLGGHVSSSVRIIPGPLPEFREEPLSSIPSLVLPRQNESESSANGQNVVYDVFISYASEDRDEVVRPLAYALQGAGLRVWYDEFELWIGDSLRRKIDKGLANSHFGVVVLSKSFFGKGWTNYELDGLVTRALTGEQIILPIWHNISKQEVMSYSPSLADKLARTTSTRTVEEIAEEIAEVIRKYGCQ